MAGALDIIATFDAVDRVRWPPASRRRPADAFDALNVLNGMVDTWQIERLMLFAQARVISDMNGNPFLLSGSQTYTLGVGEGRSTILGEPARNQPLWNHFAQ